MLIEFLIALSRRVLAPLDFANERICLPSLFVSSDALLFSQGPVWFLSLDPWSLIVCLLRRLPKIPFFRSDFPSAYNF